MNLSLTVALVPTLELFRTEKGHGNGTPASTKRRRKRR
jgi:hypothetical protein